MLGILGALLAAVCYGVGSVLQALAASRTRSGPGLDPRLLLRVMSQVPFIAGLALDAAGFGLSLVALRQLPLFVVQAIIAGNLAVTAVVATRVLQVRLSQREWAAVATVTVGLMLLVLCAGKEAPVRTSAGLHVALLGTALALLAGAGLAARFRGEYGSAALGLIAGLAFGLVGVSVRVMTDLHPGHLLRDPAAYALLLAGVLAFMCYAAALQRGRVTTALGPLVMAETVAPALIGVVALGDATRPGYTAVGVAGFVLAVAGALALTRFGSLEDRRTGALAPPSS